MEAMRMKRELHMLEQVVHYREFFQQPAHMLVSANHNSTRPHYHPLVKKFVHTVHDTGFYLHYDWKPWVRWTHYFTHQPGLVREASLLDLRKLLSCCIMNPQRGAGHLAALLEDGSMRTIMERLNQICQAFLSGQQTWTLTGCGPLPNNEGAKSPLYTYTPWCYWADPVRVLAGCYPGDLNHKTASEKLAYLLEAGIGQVINLMEPEETDREGRPFIPYQQDLMEMAARIGRDIHIDTFSIPDMGIPTEYRMREILDCIDGALEKDRPVYVHCWGGHGRTGTVVGCYLARRGVAAGKLAVKMVAQLHEPLQAAKGHSSPQAPHQIDLIRKWRAGD